MVDRRDRPERTGFWPYGTRAAVLSVPVLLVVLLAATLLLRQLADWPPAQWLGWTLLAVVLLSLLPVFLVILERLATGGGSIRVPGGFELEFEAARSVAASTGAPTISGNLGAPPGVNVLDSGGGNIREALREAVINPVAVVDLEDGRAWWETRLLALLHGASRLGRPRAIAFVATQGAVARCFIGWAPPDDLLRCQIAGSPDDLISAYHKGRARAARWVLGTPMDNNYRQVQMPWAPALTSPQTSPGSTQAVPDPPVKRSELSAPIEQYYAGEYDLMPETLLLQDLQSLEFAPNAARTVTVARLRELFDSVLRTRSIDEADSEEDKLKHILGTADDYLALTIQGRYVNLIPREVAINAVLRSIALQGDA
jgi:hypothetical protein